MRLSLLGLTLATLACGDRSASPTRQAVAPEAAVLQVVLDSFPGHLRERGVRLQDSTDDLGQRAWAHEPDWTSRLLQSVPPAYQSAVTSLLRATSPSRPLPGGLVLPAAIHRMGQAGSASAGTWLVVSNVGFSPDSARAAVYVRFQCGGLCGGGGFQLYRRTGAAHWVPDGRVVLEAS